MDGKQGLYDDVLKRIGALIDGEDDPVAVMAAVVCELHHRFDYYDWTGFYRVIRPGMLKIGPYQGTHGCLTIDFNRGVCGAAARMKRTQLVPDVSTVTDHIACSATTRSEIVVPVLDDKNRLRAVLDIDSNRLNAFDEVDKENLEKICQLVGNIRKSEKKKVNI